MKAHPGDGKLWHAGEQCPVCSLPDYRAVTVFYDERDDEFRLVRSDAWGEPTDTPVPDEEVVCSGRVGGHRPAIDTVQLKFGYLPPVPAWQWRREMKRLADFYAENWRQEWAERMEWVERRVETIPEPEGTRAALAKARGE